MRLAILTLCILSNSALADIIPIPLKDGVVYLGDSCGENGKSPECRLTFEIKGEAAKLLYHRMAGKPSKDTCTETLVKSDGKGMRCFKDGDRYDCDFGYSFKKRKMTGSDMSC